MLKKIHRILIIKLRSHGDVLLTTPLFSILKARYPEARIDAYIYEDSLPLLSGHPAIFQIISCKREKKRGVKWLWNECKRLYSFFRAKYDLVIQLTEGDRGALVAACSFAKIRIGVDPKKTGLWGKGFFYTHLLRYPHLPRHTVEKHIDALRLIGIFPTEEEKKLFLHIPPESEKVLLAHLGSKCQNYIVIHPVARWMFKSLPSEWMGKLLFALLEKGKHVVVTGSSDKEEMEYIEKMVSNLRHHPNLTLLAGKLQLKELAACIKKCRLLICVDSLVFHMASTFKKPCVAFFGPSSEKNWGPWKNPYARIVTSSISCRPCYMRGCADSGKSACLASFPMDKVLTLVDSLIE